MSVSSFEVAITQAQAVTVTATMCSAPTYTVSAVRLYANPVFSDTATINGSQYGPGSPLISATGGTVASTAPFVVQGATTAAISSTTINGTYSTANLTAAFVIPFGTTFNGSTNEYDVGGSPRLYDYTARFISISGGVTATADLITAGSIRLSVGSVPRVPLSDSTYKACSVTQA
jgi:hypothetical protein